jgi:hypothetical protein
MMPHLLRPGDRAAMVRIAALAVLAALAPGWSDAPRAQSAPPAAAPSPANPVLDAARAAFGALPEADRKAVQDALVWTGDYSGPLDGALGRGGLAAIQAFERRANAPTADGILSDAERAALLAAGDKGRKAERFAVIDDKPTGIRLGVPLARFEPSRPRPGGTVWRAKDGKVVLETTLAAADATLPVLFETLRTVTPPTKVTYSVLRADWFVITTETDKTRTYTRYGVPPLGGAPRGFSFTYDKTLGPQLDRVSVALSNSFRPDAAAATPIASAGSATAPATGAGTVPATAAAAGPRLINAVRLSAEWIATSATALKGCAAPLLNGQPVTPGPETDGIVLIRADGRAPSGLATGASVPAGGETIVAAFAGDPARPVATLFPGAMVAGSSASTPARLLAGLQPGAGGAGVYDRAGRLVGLVEQGPDERTRVAGLVVPQRTYRILPITPAAASARLAPGPEGQPRSTGQIGGIAAPAAVAIRCGN